MNSANQDKGKSVSNLQKLFSSHVLEKKCLKRQKSGLDHERRKKLKELTNNEQLFLRRYEKYIVPGNRSRRHSIDAELARAIEVNYNAGSRPQSSTANKSFVKDSINDECPYSLESWNRLVDSEKSIIDENKQDILFGDDKTSKDGNSSDENTEMVLDEMFRTNISLLESGRRLQKRQTLKPIETTNGNLNENVIDEEIVEIQLKQKKRGRRHSVALGALYGGHLNRDTGLKLPSISERKGSFSKKKKSLSDSDFEAEPEKSRLHSSDDNISFSGRNVTKSSRRLSLADGRSELNMPSPVPEINKLTKNSVSNEEDSVKEDGHIILKDNLKEITKQIPSIKINDLNSATDIAEDTALQRRNTPRPVANATIFVQQESNHDKNSIFDTGVKKDDTEKNDPVEYEEKQQPSFLPKIEVTRPDGLEDTVSNSNKHVSFVDEENQMRDRSDSGCSKVTTDSEFQPKKRGRRISMTTATLKLLVDSHQGAAKLRYMARLAQEMEREEIAKHTPEPEPDIYKELNDCRYLRVVSRKGSSQSRDSFQSDSSHS